MEASSFPAASVSCRNLGKSGLRVSCLGLGELEQKLRKRGTILRPVSHSSHGSEFSLAGTWVTFGSQISDEVYVMGPRNRVQVVVARE